MAPRRALPFGSHAVDFVIALVLLGTTHGIAVMLSQGKSIVNSPVQSTLFLTCIFSYHETFARNFKRSLYLTLGTAAFLALTSGVGYLAQTSIQFIIGFTSGMSINYHFVE